MVLQMARPSRHPKTGIYLFRKRVPDALRGIIGKTEEKISLGTRDPAEARILHSQVATEVEARWQQFAKGIQALTHRQAEAIAGEIYRAMIAEHEDNPDHLRMSPLLFDRIMLGKPGAKVYYLGSDPAKTKVMFQRMNTARNQQFVDDWLAGKGLLLDSDSRKRLLTAVEKAVWQAREQLHRMSKGDYRADPDADRFPTLELDDTKSKGNRAGKTSPIAVFEAYAVERGITDGSVKKWRPYFEQIEKEHADIADITRGWVLNWKDRLLAKGLSHRHVKESYLASLSAVCGWAVDNGKLTENPAVNIKIRIPKKSKTRLKGYTDAEAKQVLAASLRPASTGISSAYRSARRWVPWLCAYTGARIGEIGQLRKEDVQECEGVWCLWITPEAGTTKDGNARWVAIHSCLIEQGFLDFVRSSRVGPLFYDTSRKRNGREANAHFRKVGEHLARWVRSDEIGITDKELKPNHGWRHRFKTLSRKHGLDPAARDYMQGHAPATVGEDYGDWTPDALLLEISKLPTINVTSASS
jgi:integrase